MEGEKYSIVTLSVNRDENCLPNGFLYIDVCMEVEGKSMCCHVRVRASNCQVDCNCISVAPASLDSLWGQGKLCLYRWGDALVDGHVYSGRAFIALPVSMKVSVPTSKKQSSFT